MAGLAPGDYRVIAVSAEAMLADPPLEALRRSLATASKVEVSRGGVLNIRVELGEIR